MTLTMTSGFHCFICRNRCIMTMTMTSDLDLGIIKSIFLILVAVSSIRRAWLWPVQYDLRNDLQRRPLYYVLTIECPLYVSSEVLVCEGGATRWPWYCASTHDNVEHVGWRHNTLDSGAEAAGPPRQRQWERRPRVARYSVGAAGMHPQCIRVTVATQAVYTSEIHPRIQDIMHHFMILVSHWHTIFIVDILRLAWTSQGSKLLGFRMSRTPRNGNGNPILGPGFPTETQELSGQRTALNWGFLTGNPEIAGENQIPRQVFRRETQILIVISSPDLE